MAAAVRRLVVCMGCCVAGLLVWLTWLSGGAPVSRGVVFASASGGPRSKEPWALRSFAIPGLQGIDGNQQALDAERARRASPEAFVARERSRTKFAHLGATGAARVAREVFPALVERRDGGMPVLPAGDKLRRFSAENVAQISLPHHERGIIESLQPMAVRTASGQFEPIDLALRDDGSSYVPSVSQVAVQIPRRLGEGVRAVQSGVSLTPVNADGGALAGSEGSVEGASVLYANTQTDTDTLAKPTSRGFDLSAILRSEASPRELYYRLGLPGGASLVQHGGRSPVQVVRGGTVVGMLLPPTAVDAAGTPVPVTMRASGDIVSVTVQNEAGEYQYPVQVDPEYSTGKDRSLSGGVWPVEHAKEGETNWKPIFTSHFSEEHTYKKEYNHGGNPEWYDQSWYIEPTREYNEREFAGLRYRTQGDSTIYNLEMWVEGENEPSQTATAVEYRYGPEEEGQDNHVTLSEGTDQTLYEEKPLSMTSGYLSNPLETPRENDVRLMDYTTRHESLYGFWTLIYQAQVYVAQEESKHPEAESTSACPQCGFNKSSATITGAGDRTNVLYGSGSWLSPYQGAYEVTAHDAGVGIDYASITGAGLFVEQPIRDEEGRCLGIQCPETYTRQMVYSSSMANGDDSIELLADDGAEMAGYSYATIKVDASKPYDLGFTGMPEEGAEIDAAPHTLTVHATDGKKPTPSSGIRSISVSIDHGTPTEVAGASCPEGECTASGAYTLDAENLSEGVHSLVLSAVSNSGEPAEAKEFLFDVRHASPVSVGPGLVDPTTGQLTLTANDVSLGGSSGVSRSYQSRNLTAGESGPLGPQWAMSVGGGEGLTVLPSGNVVLTSSSGGTTTFTLNSKGTFEAPKGDENLKIEYKSTERKYVLKDANAGSETVFEQPVGAQGTPPTYGGAFGAEAGVLNRPVSDALDSSGNVWVTDWTDDRIAKFTSKGALLGTYGFEGSESGEFREPFGIAVNQSTGNVYVSDYGNSRIDEYSSSGVFVRAFGWGVSNGEAALQTCTSSCKAGLGGGGAGQLSGPDGVAIDSSGHVWVAEEGNDRVQEFSETGGYITAFGSAGSGAGQLEAPMDIAFTGSDLYVTDQNNERVDEFTTSGTFVKTIGWGVSNGEEKLETCTSSCRAGIAGSGGGQFYIPRGVTVDPISGNLYVVNTDSDCLQEITTAGVFVAKACSGGSGPGQFNGPMGVAASSAGLIYITDFNNSRVQEWSRSIWWPTSAKGSLPTHTTYIYTPVEGGEGATSMQPYEVISPTPQGVECGTKPEELKAEKDNGCRALTFKYATETKAKGESESEWGEYKGHLSEVMFHAWNPSAKAMEEKAVAEYSYDKQGRLRAEWDPRMESSTACGKTCSALKTIYGYDAEGHVTALTPPGQESWAFTYGAIAGDPDMGRLLKTTRAPASTGLWEGRLPVNEEGLPRITGTPMVKSQLAVSHGGWSNRPVAYAYQWEDCNTSGAECTSIVGAANPNYMPTSGDVGHTLRVQVTATNGGGSVVAVSLASAAVTTSDFTQSVDSGNGINAVSCIPDTTDCVLSDSKGNVLYATNVSSSTEAAWKIWNGPASPSEAVACSTSTMCVLADGSVVETGGGKLYYATSLDGSWSEAYNPVFGVLAASCPSSSFCIDGQERGRVRYSTNPASTSWTELKIGEASSSGAIVGVSCLSSSFCVGVDKGGELYVANTEAHIKEVSGWKSTNIDSSAALHGVSCTSTTSCVAVDGVGDIVNLTISSESTATASKRDIDGANELTAITCTGSSTCAAVDNVGNIFVSTNAGETWTERYSLDDKLTSVSCASSSLCAAVDTTGHVTAFSPSATGGEGETKAPSPGATIEYHVPLSGAEGSDLPSLTKEEVEKWGQKDKNEYEDNDPVEGMAVFPPDEPQGWPASDYKRATIDYVNERGLTVNTAAPTGGITTTEYNELNEAVRTLSADNRAAAVKEGCISVSKKECKSAEVSEKLDTKTEYGAFGSDILKVVGPEHKVKLSTGEEAEARAVTHNYYNEGAKEAEEKNKESYNLITKSTSGALLASGEERDVRTTTTSYGGQGDLGWKLRKPTSTILEPATLDLVHKTVYEEHENAKKEIESTGDVVEARAPAGNSEQVSPPSFSSNFGSKGSGNGQFKEPWAVSLDSSGNVWALDTGNDRIEKFSSSGVFSAAYGKEGTGDSQFKEPLGIAVNQSTGDVYVSDNRNDRIQEFNSSGEFVEAIGWGVGNEKAELEVCKTSCKAGIGGSGNGQFSYPSGLTVDSHGDIWVVDNGNDRVEEFSEAGLFLQQFGSEGTGNGQFKEPDGITISEGSVYVVDHGNDRVEQFSLAGAYMGQFGSKGSAKGQFDEPVGITTNSNTGVLYVCDAGNSRMQEFSPAGKFLTEWKTWGSTHEQDVPVGVAVGSTGKLYIIDVAGNAVEIWLPPESGGANLSYSTQFGSKGTGNGQFNEPAYSAIDGQGNVWITDYKNDRIEKFGPDGSFIAAYGKEGSGEVQFNGPAGVAINKSTGSIYVADKWNNRIEELSSSGAYIATIGTSGSGKLKEPTGVAIDSSGNVWVADRGNDRIVEFSSTGTYIAAYGKEGTGEDQFKSPAAIAFSGEDIYVADSANHRIEELTNKGAYVRAWGIEGNGSDEFWTPEGIATDAAGNLYVVDINADHVEEFSPTGAYKATFGAQGSAEGQFTHPEGDSIDAAGDLYVVDQGDNRVEKWDNNQQDAHDVKTAYYSAKEESPVTACRNHPEWANLPCQTEPAAQPDHGLPELPVTTIKSYDMWDIPEVTEEKFGTGSKAVTRTKTETYDPAGRAVTSEETASPATDTSLPKVTNEYNSSTGALETQSTSAGTITSKYNTLGQLTEYKDASGNVAKYTYEEGSDGRLEEISEGKGKEAESSQTYSYNATTGFMEKLVDSAAGTFTASYDLEGKMTSEVYPNGMCANMTYNSVGQATSLEYIKTRNCSETGASVWFSDSVVPSIHGETLQQTSTLSKESYAYDNAGRLLETQETPAGKGCVVRLYSYEEESNRTSETTREPGTEGKCATEGGTVERHTYDEANRLTDEGIEYETFGNTTKLPASDADGHELVSTYYVDNQLASQEQNKQLVDYTYDPLGRTLETASENKETKAKSTKIFHYAGAGGAQTWTSEGSEKWVRNIPGLDGTLCATQEAGKAPVLQLHDLQGDVVATAADNESETKLLTTYNSTEFGVPNEGKTPPKYAWLGAAGVSTETSFESGVATQNGESYVPQVARALQTAPVVPPGAFPNGSPGTQFTAAVESAGAIAGAQEIATQFWQKAEAERQKAKEEEARKQLEQCQAEGGCGAEVEPVSEVDPGMCVAVGGLHQIFEVNGHLSAPYANFHCHGRAYDVEISVCLISAGAVPGIAPFKDCWDEGKPLELGEEGPGKWAEFGIPLKDFQCTVNEKYYLWIWYWEAGMSSGAVGYGHDQTCVKDSVEIWKTGMEAISSDE
jgi:DNA-binding beta-propeller fold protein YncE